MEKLDLKAQVGRYFAAREKNSVAGLVLLDACIKRVAEHRDWDALARFVARANMADVGPRVKRIIRAAFGDDLTYKADKKHETGGRFEMKWDGAYVLKNTYNIVEQAIADKNGWDSRILREKLHDVLPEKAKPELVVNEKLLDTMAEHMFKYLSDKVKDSHNTIRPGDVLARVHKLAAAKVVGEPNH